MCVCQTLFPRAAYKYSHSMMIFQQGAAGKLCSRRPPKTLHNFRVNVPAKTVSISSPSTFSGTSAATLLQFSPFGSALPLFRSSAYKQDTSPDEAGKCRKTAVGARESWHPVQTPDLQIYRLSDTLPIVAFPVCSGTHSVKGCAPSSSTARSWGSQGESSLARYDVGTLAR